MKWLGILCMRKNVNKNIPPSSFYEYAFNDFPDDEIRHGILYLNVAPPHAKQSKNSFYIIQIECSDNTCMLVQMHWANCVKIIGTDMLKH